MFVGKTIVSLYKKSCHYNDYIFGGQYGYYIVKINMWAKIVYHLGKVAFTEM